MLILDHIFNYMLSLHYNQYVRCHLGSHLAHRSSQRCDFEEREGAFIERTCQYKCTPNANLIDFCEISQQYTFIFTCTQFDTCKHVRTYCELLLYPHKTFGLKIMFHTASANILFPPSTVTLPGALLAPVSSTLSSLSTRRSSANSSSSMQTSYRLPNPLPPLPVRKGVRGRRPKSQTIALLKAAAEAAAAAAVNGTSQSPARTGFEVQLAPRPHKKRGPKPKNKVR